MNVAIMAVFAFSINLCEHNTGWDFRSNMDVLMHLDIRYYYVASYSYLMLYLSYALLIFWIVSYFVVLAKCNVDHLRNIKSVLILIFYVFLHCFPL